MTTTLTRKAIKQTAISLYQLSDIIGSKRFLSLLDSKHGRFKTDISPIVCKLKSDFDFQLQQSIDSGFKREYRQSTGQRNVPMQEALPVMAKQISTLADSICEDDVAITQKDKRFTVPRGQPIDLCIYTAFNGSRCYEINRTIVSIQNTSYSVDSSFDVRNFISSLGVLIESLNTLDHPTGAADFDNLVETLIDNTRYFTDGYPHDLLAIDASQVKTGELPLHINYNEKYCSTFIAKEPQAAQAGFIACTIKT